VPSEESLRRADSAPIWGAPYSVRTMQLQVRLSLVAQGLGVLLGAEYVFAALPADLLCRPIDGFDQLTVHCFARADESNPLILDFMEIAAEEAMRVQLRLAATTGKTTDPD